MTVGAIGGLCAILRHPVSLSLERLDQIVSNFVTVADESFRHLMRKGEGNEDAAVVTVFQPPIIPDGKSGSEHGLCVAEVAVHDGTGGQHAADKTDALAAGDALWDRVQ